MGCGRNDGMWEEWLGERIGNAMVNAFLGGERRLQERSCVFRSPAPTHNRTNTRLTKKATRTWISDREDTDAEVFTARRSQLDVVAVVVMDSGLGQHGVVFDLTFTELRAIAGDDDKLGLALSQRLEGLLHSQAVFPALHDQSESGVDALQRLLGFLCRNHFDSFFY